jgi:hypothetical protein
MRHRLCLAVLLVACGAPAPAQERLPVTADADLAGLQANARAVLDALRTRKSPLPKGTARRLQRLLAAPATDEEAAGKIQEELDAYCLVAVSINPESRVKARRGPAAADLVQDQSSFVLAKVYNEAGVTHALAVQGPHVRAADGESKEGSWLEASVSAPGTRRGRLNGQKVQYVLLRLVAHEAGKREATLQFDAGQGTQDLGFRAEVPILFTVRPAR